MWQRRKLSQTAESVWGKVLVTTNQCLAVLRASERQSLEDKRSAQKLLVKTAPLEPSQPNGKKHRTA